MSTQEAESVLDAIVQKQNQSWGEERVRNLGATVESLMQRRGYNPSDLEFDQDDFELAA